MVAAEDDQACWVGTALTSLCVRLETPDILLEVDERVNEATLRYPQLVLGLIGLHGFDIRQRRVALHNYKLWLEERITLKII